MRFLQNICPKLIYRFSRGGGGQLEYIFKFVLSLCNQISTSTFDLRFALLVHPQSENASYAPGRNGLTNGFIYIAIKMR